MNEDRHRPGVDPVGQIGRADPLPLAPVRLIAHHGHGEMHRFGMGLGRGGDRVETWLEFTQHLDQFVGSESGLRITFENVDHFPAINPVVHHRFCLRIGQLRQLGSRRALLENGGEQLPRRLAQGDLMGQYFTQVRSRTFDRFFARQSHG